MLKAAQSAQMDAWASERQELKTQIDELKEQLTNMQCVSFAQLKVTNQCVLQVRVQRASLGNERATRAERSTIGARAPVDS